MIKILFLIHALNPGGAQRVLVEMVNNMDAKQYDITVQTLFDKGGLKRELQSNIRYRTIFKGRNKLIDTFRAWLLRRAIPPKTIYNRYIKSDYDYEVGYLEGECTRVVSASTNEYCKKYAWVHTNFAKNFSSQGLYKTLDEHRKVYRNFDKIVCISNGVRDGFIERFGFNDNVIVKYNILDDAKIIEKANTTPTLILNSFKKRDCVYFIAVGNMRPEKSYDRLLRVCKRLKDDGFKYDLSIVGTGSVKKEIKTLQDDFELCDCVHLLGEQLNPYPFIRQSDCLICSSLEEGYSTVTVEACILQVPVLTTSCCSMNEILDGGKYGIIVTNDEDGIYMGMKKVIENPELLNYYRKLLSERKMFFSKERNIKEIEKLFTY